MTDIIFFYDDRQFSDLRQELLQFSLSMSIKRESSLNFPEQGIEPWFSAQNPIP